MDIFELLPTRSRFGEGRPNSQLRTILFYKHEAQSREIGDDCQSNQ